MLVFRRYKNEWLGAAGLALYAQGVTSVRHGKNLKMGTMLRQTY